MYGSHHDALVLLLPLGVACLMVLGGVSSDMRRRSCRD